MKYCNSKGGSNVIIKPLTKHKGKLYKCISNTKKNVKIAFDFSDAIEFQTKYSKY